MNIVPQLLAQHRCFAAVLVSVEAWDKLAAELKRLRRIIETVTVIEDSDL